MPYFLVLCDLSGDEPQLAQEPMSIYGPKAGWKPMSKSKPVLSLNLQAKASIKLGTHLDFDYDAESESERNIKRLIVKNAHRKGNANLGTASKARDLTARGLKNNKNPKGQKMRDSGPSGRYAEIKEEANRKTTPRKTMTRSHQQWALAPVSLEQLEDLPNSPVTTTPAERNIRPMLSVVSVSPPPPPENMKTWD